MSSIALQGCCHAKPRPIPLQRAAPSPGCCPGETALIGCVPSLNYDEVGAGTHPISAISQGQQPATVRILKAGGAGVWHGNTLPNAIDDITGAEKPDEGPPADALPPPEDRRRPRGRRVPRRVPFRRAGVVPPSARDSPIEIGQIAAPAYSSGPRSGAAELLRQPAFGDPGGDPGPGVEPELAQDVLHVPLGGAYGDDQPCGDLRVGQPVGDQVGDLQLPPGQWGRLDGRGRWTARRLRLQGESDRLRRG